MKTDDMKIFLSAIAILILLLTIIDKLRARFGYKNASYNSTGKWLIIGICICVLLLGLAGHQYYITKSSGAFTKMLIPAVCLMVMIDLWRRKK